jgi:hypothetical protein
MVKNQCIKGCIYDILTYNTKLEGYTTLSDINKLYDMPFDIKLCVENKIQLIMGDNGK